MKIEHVLGGVESIRDNSARNVVVPVAGDPCFSNVVGRSRRRAFAHLRRRHELAGRRLLAVGADDTDLTGTGPAVEGSTNCRSRDSSVLGGDQWGAVVVVGGLDAWAVDVVLEDRRDLPGDPVDTLAVDLVFQRGALIRSVTDLDVGLVFVELHVTEVERADATESNSGVPCQRPQRVIA